MRYARLDTLSWLNFSSYLAARLTLLLMVVLTALAIAGWPVVISNGRRLEGDSETANPAWVIYDQS